MAEKHIGPAYTCLFFTGDDTFHEHHWSGRCTRPWQLLAILQQASKTEDKLLDRRGRALASDVVPTLAVRMQDIMVSVAPPAGVTQLAHARANCSHLRRKRLRSS